MSKKFLIALTIVAVVGATGALAASPVSALTVDEIQTQIRELLAKVGELTKQLNILQSQNATPTPDTSNQMPTRHRICSVLYRNLSPGTQGDDVVSLQEFLRSEGYLSANATGYFGPMTREAVARWQASQGVSSVGSVGPVSRERIKIWCGSPTPTCRPINYIAPLCEDGPAPQPVHDVNGCITGYQCPVANFTPSANCKVWNDGCNICSRDTPESSAMCTTRACFAAGKGYCVAYFTDSGSRPPSISLFSGPTTLNINQTGTWTIQASDPENGPLSYSVAWGDEYMTPAPMASYAAREAFVQTTTFTHTYSSAGTYTITIIVRDSSGQEAKTSTTVRVGEVQAYCTLEYSPVCGQPPEPACRNSIPACMMASPGPQTYSNRCMMNAAGAAFLYEGQCGGGYACTADAMQCPNGTWVGRTGPNCQFVCPN